MTPILSRVNRYAPLIIAITALVALLQLISSFVRWFGVGVPVAWVLDHAAWIEGTLALAAFATTSLVILGALHARSRLPILITRWTLLMDILDRLTNRHELEQRLRPKADAIYIDAEALATSLKSKVIGQDAVCDEVAAQIRRRLALQQRNKPVGVFLFAGPPGSGKTYLGKAIAGALDRKLVHLDMTQYSTAGLAATSLFGSPRGYVGSESYGKLTSALRDTPNAVVLLDEFEKAHSNVHKNFLTAWNDGFVSEASNGSQISTAASIFILTTNAAVDSLAAISQQYADNPDELRRNADAALRGAGFAPEVLSRIDRLFVFSPLADLDIARVAALEIEDMIKGYGLSITGGGIDPQILIDLMTRHAKLGNSGSSRDLVRAIEESIADSLIDAKQNGALSVSLVAKYDRVEAVIAG
jgi:ATP-dependent Clp protease ATP-binding subunit ClpE